MNRHGLLRRKVAHAKSIAIRCAKCGSELKRQILDVTFCLERGCEATKVVLMACANGHVEIQHRKRKSSIWGWRPPESLSSS